MVWQEWLFVLGNFAQVFMLVPMLRQKMKPPLLSSVPLALTLALFTYAFYSLGLNASAVAMGTVTAIWAALAWQRYADA